MTDTTSSLNGCPKCGDVADNGHDREWPPNNYVCTKCETKAQQPSGDVPAVACGESGQAVGGKDDNLASLANQKWDGIRERINKINMRLQEEGELTSDEGVSALAICYELIQQHIMVHSEDYSRGYDVGYLQATQEMLATKGDASTREDEDIDTSEGKTFHNSGTNSFRSPTKSSDTLIGAIYPCPFCKAEAHTQAGRAYRVKCTSCYFAAPERDTPEDAQAAWNSLQVKSSEITGNINDSVTPHLLPCPKCGAVACPCGQYNNGLYGIRCSECHMMNAVSTYEKAIEDWNNRPISKRKLVNCPSCNVVFGIEAPKREYVDVNDCGIWCPNCGSHLKSSEKEFLRHLVDVVWNCATESEAVPATFVADDLITKAKNSHKGQ